MSAPRPPFVPAQQHLVCVRGSAMFKDLTLLWETLVDEDTALNWGAAWKSLFPAEVVLEELDSLCNTAEKRKQFKELRWRCKQIGMETFIDLEN